MKHLRFSRNILLWFILGNKPDLLGQEVVVSAVGFGQFALIACPSVSQCHSICCSSFHLTSILILVHHFVSLPFCFITHPSSTLFCFVLVCVMCAWVGVAWVFPHATLSLHLVLVSLACGRQRQLDWICSVVASHWLFVHGLSLGLSNGKVPCMETQGGVAGYKFSWVLLSGRVTYQYHLRNALGFKRSGYQWIVEDY